MSHAKEIGVTLLAAAIPAGFNLADINDLLTSGAALLSIGFTIYRSITLSKNQKNERKEQEK